MKRWLCNCGVLLAALTVGCLSEGSSLLGTQFSVGQFGDTLYISGRQVFLNESIQYDALFPSASLPDTCGDRLWRCNITCVEDPANNREVVLSPHSDGIAMALFTNVNTDQFSLESQFVVRPQVAINCSMTSITENLQVACLYFLPDQVTFEVKLWLFELRINFDALNETILVLLNDINRPYQSYSSGLSRIFNVVTSTDNIVVWYDDEVLFEVHLDPPSDEPVQYYAETTNNVCFFKNVTDIRLSDDLHNLLVYCSQNTLAEVSVRDRGGLNTLVEETLTRFYCPRGGYIEERNEKLAFVSPGLMDHIIPPPFNLSRRHVADCAIVSQNHFLVATSEEDGLVVSTDIINNETTVLLYNAPSRHQLIDGRVLLYSNFTHSGVLDLACPSQLLLSNHTFLLSTFELNPDYVCPEEPSVTTAMPTIVPTTVTVPKGPSVTVTASTQQLATMSLLPVTTTTSMNSLGEPIIIGLSVGLSAVTVAFVGIFVVILCVAWKLSPNRNNRGHNRQFTEFDGIGITGKAEPDSAGTQDTEIETSFTSENNILQPQPAVDSSGNITQELAVGSPRFFSNQPAQPETGAGVGNSSFVASFSPQGSSMPAYNVSVTDRQPDNNRDLAHANNNIMNESIVHNINPNRVLD